MLSRDDLVRMTSALRETRVLSVYLDGAPADPVVRTTWGLELQRTLARLRDGLAGAPRAEREAFDRCVALLDAQLERLGSDSPGRGWVGFFPVGGDPHVETLPFAAPTLVAWDDGPRVAPYLGLLTQHEPAIIAVVDSRRARVHRLDAGTLQRVGVLRAPRHEQGSTHTSAPPRPGFHFGTRGRTAHDEAERERIHGRHALVRQLAARLERLAGAHGMVLVGGIPEVVAEAARALPERMRSRVRRLTTIDVHDGPAAIVAAAGEELERVRREEELALVERLLERRVANGLAVTGTEATLEALREHAAQCLCFTPAFVREHPAMAEAIVRAAVETNVDLQQVAGAGVARLGIAGGVGALLRRRLLREQPPVTLEAGVA